jgi:hypothetical protein
MRNMCKLIFGGLVAGGMLLSVPATLLAQQQPRNTVMLEARKRINEAQAVVTDLKAEQKRIKDKVLVEYAEKEEWKNTAANHKKAKAAYEASKKQALTSLQAKPEYKQLVKDRTALQTKLEEVSNQRNADPDVIAKTGTELANKGYAIKKMESEVMTTDEKAVAAKEAFDAAEKEMKSMDEEVEASLQTDPDYAAIQVQVEQAELLVTQAKEAAAAAQKQEAEARRAARPAPAPKKSRGTEGLE